MSMLALAACLAAGFCVGRFLRLPERAQKITGLALAVCLFLLMFILGVKLGGNGILLSGLGGIGINALVLALGCTAGSILMVKGYLLVSTGIKGRKN